MEALDRPLTTLESVTLGIIQKRGPCIAHDVVQEFASSQTHAYRSGAGSIYPLLRRLTSAGYLDLSGRMYSITTTGTEHLRRWLMPPFGEDEVTTSLDLIRGRLYFLKILSPAERATTISAARSALHELLLACEVTLEKYQDRGDRFSECAMIGTIRETQARLAWLDDVEPVLLAEP